jgi:hypothetical protein
MSGLSKSRIQYHRQCPRRLWLQAYRPKLAEVDPAVQRQFDIGNQVGEIARSFHPDGVLIDATNRDKQLADTAMALAGSPRPVFEATFEADGVLVRADLLLPDAGGYRLVEVKSAAKVKPHYLDDAAIQAWVMRKAGIPVTRVEVAVIDTSFTYLGDGDYTGLLKHVDVTVATRSFEPQIAGWVNAARETLASREPLIDVGDHCEEPNRCPFFSSCAPKRLAGAHADYPVEILPHADELAIDLRIEGYGDMREVPPYRLKNPIHQRIQRVCASGRYELSPEAEEEIRTQPYPRYYLDFETINPAVPVWPGTRPYQQIPFQWSCHVESKSGALEHKAFLASGDGDPRRAFAESLVEVLGNTGTIFVYNAGTERSHMRHLALCFPDLAPALNAAIARIVDLLPIARQHYYHPDMLGSWSIKDVLPTIAPELAYDNLEVGNGTQAMRVFAELMNPDLPDARQSSLRESLLRYCERDTLAMVKVAHFFENAPHGGSRHILSPFFLP